MWFSLPFRPKRNPDKDLDRLSISLRDALGPRLKSVIVFGSHARGEYDPKRSNVNVLVVSDLSYESLELMGPAVRDWIRQGHILPVLVAPDDLDDFARDFPIEFLDMQDHRRVIWGEDVLANLKVDSKHLESQVEHDLALLQLRLRQSLALANRDVGIVRRALERSASSLRVLLAVARRLGDERAAGLDKMRADIPDLAAVRVGNKEVEVRDFSKRYLSVIDAVLGHLRRK